jgi:hypothetical protein
MLAEITLAQWITLVVALVGAVLGIINTWQNLSKSRVKLRVLPKRAIPSGAPIHALRSVSRSPT